MRPPGRHVPGALLGAPQFSRTVLDGFRVGGRVALLWAASIRWARGRRLRGWRPVVSRAGSVGGRLAWCRRLGVFEPPACRIRGDDTGSCCEWPVCQAAAFAYRNQALF